MNESALLFAYHFPPENAIGAERPARFAKYLPGYGWNCTVITAAEQQLGSHPGVRDLADTTRAYWELKPGPQPSAIRRWSELVLRRFLFPGAIGLGWSIEAVPFACQSLRSENPSAKAVISSFPPLAAHLAASRLARRFGLPWIADFRDPYASQWSESAPRPSQWMASYLERRFFRQAAAIIVNTEAMAALYRERYPMHAGKISVIWNGFDPEIPFGPLPVPPRPHHELSHVGALYAGRNPLALIHSLERLRAAGNPEALRCEVALVGPSSTTREESEVILRAVGQGWVRWDVRQVPKTEATRISQEADGLLLLQPQSKVQVPGKLFEYLRIGRPILSLAPRDSAIEYLLDRCGIPHVDIYPDEPAEEMDRKVAGFLRMPSDPTLPSQWFEQNFNALHQAEQLAAILDRITAGTALQ